MHIVIGACGWDHEQWQEQFYPDDIPSDWRLGYYANEFESVLVPFNVWSAVDIDEIENWFDDIPDEFELFFEVNPDACNASVKKMLSHELFSQRQVVFSAVSLSFELPKCTVEQGTILDCVLKDEKVSKDEKIAILRFSSEDVIKVEEIRQIIEKAYDDNREFDALYVFFDQALVDVNLLNSAKIIVDLMIVID